MAFLGRFPQLGSPFSETENLKLPAIRNSMVNTACPGLKGLAFIKDMLRMRQKQHKLPTSGHSGLPFS